MSRIIACLPTKFVDPLAAVIKISPFSTKGMLIALSLTKTSSSENIKVSFLIFDDLKTRIPVLLISVGL